MPTSVTAALTQKVADAFPKLSAPEQKIALGEMPHRFKVDGRHLSKGDHHAKKL